MPSYDRNAVQNTLPVTAMLERFNRQRGTKARFFSAIVADAAKRKGLNLTAAEVESRASNLAFNFTRFADGRQDTLPTGDNVALDDISGAWQHLVATGNYVGGNGNGNGGQGSAAPAQAPTGTQTRRAAEAAEVPPVSPSVFESAKSALEAVRTGEVDPPTSADEAYMILWDRLDPTVKIGPSSGVISGSLARLAAENRDLFAGIITTLPEDVRGALMDALEAKASDVVNASLKTAVEQVYHISVGKQHASKYFRMWDDQVQQHLDWMGRDEPYEWEPSDENRATANRDAAVAALRALTRGLDAEVKASTQVAPGQPLQPIQFNEVMDRLDPAQIAEVGRQWSKMTPEQQHAFVADLNKEKSGEVTTTEAAAEVTEDKPVADAPAGEPKEEDKPAEGRSTRRR